MRIIVDGYCLGNPGPAGYRGVDADSGQELFREDVGEGTNNIAEFLGICRAFHYSESRGIKPHVISDSLTAISWVTKKRVKSSYKGEVIKRVEKAVEFLKGVHNYTLEKWDTKNLGENPADFGNK